MKIALIFLGLVVVGVGVVESALRLFFGFGNPPLYVADSQVGYRLAPNQKLKRLGNRLEVNQYSMRGAAIARHPDPKTLRVLLLGDSIANGGWWTDQADILSAKIRDRIAFVDRGRFQAAEVLNASANSWGPRNELAYLAKFGTFQAAVVVLLINTDDLFATAPTSLPVGRDRQYPDRRPPLALFEVIGRLRKRSPLPELQEIKNEGGDRVGVNLEAIRQIQQIAERNNAGFILAMTPLLREISPGPRDYEMRARDRLERFVKTENIPYIDFLDQFRGISPADSLYRDHIHLSAEGNSLVSQMLGQAIQDLISPQASVHRALPDSLLDDPWQVDA